MSYNKWTWQFRVIKWKDYSCRQSHIWNQYEATWATSEMLKLLNHYKLCRSVHKKTFYMPKFWYRIKRNESWTGNTICRQILSVILNFPSCLRVFLANFLLDCHFNWRLNGQAQCLAYWFEKYCILVIQGATKVSTTVSWLNLLSCDSCYITWGCVNCWYHEIQLLKRFQPSSWIHTTQRSIIYNAFYLDNTCALLI